MNDSHPTLEARIRHSGGFERRVPPVRVGRGAFAHISGCLADRDATDCSAEKPSVRLLTRFFDPHTSAVPRRPLDGAVHGSRPRSRRWWERSARCTLTATDRFGIGTGIDPWSVNPKCVGVLPPRTGRKAVAEIIDSRNGRLCGGQAGDGRLPNTRWDIVDATPAATERTGVAPRTLRTSLSGEIESEVWRFCRDGSHDG